MSDQLISLLILILIIDHWHPRFLAYSNAETLQWMTYKCVSLLVRKRRGDNARVDLKDLIQECRCFRQSQSCLFTC
jgi:hypothetical protein